MADSLMQAFYDSEINPTVKFASFWDDGFEVQLGDEIVWFRAGVCQLLET